MLPAYIRTTSMVACIIVMILGILGNLMVIFVFSLYRRQLRSSEVIDTIVVIFTRRDRQVNVVKPKIGNHATTLVSHQTFERERFSDLRGVRLSLKIVMRRTEDK